MELSNPFLADLQALAKPKKEGGGAHNQNRVNIIQSLIGTILNPAVSTKDSPAEIAYNEEQLLGISVTCSKIDSCDLSQVNCTCKEFIEGKGGFILMGVEITTVKEHKTKKGKTPGKMMAFLTVCDSTCSLNNVIAFPEVFKEYAALLYEGNTILVQGDRDPEGALLIQKVWQAK